MPTTSARPTDHAVRVENPIADSVTSPVADMVADIVEIWGHDSFPASDPPTNW